jgi:hypothetical protein
MLKKSLRHLSGLEANAAGEDGVVACEFARHASDVQRTDGSPAREIIELLARLGVIFQRGIVRPENFGTISLASGNQRIRGKDNYTTV